MTNKIFISKILFLTLLMGMSGCGEDKEPVTNNTELDSLQNALEEQEHLNDSLRQVIEQEDLQEDFPIYFGRGFDTIENPEEFIVNSLEQHPDLIPLSPVLGGTMEFRQIKVLTGDWVLGIYDDGHVQGKSIFSYKIGPNGQLQFEHLLSSPQK